MDTTQRRGPLLLGEEHIADVASHCRQVYREGREVTDVAMDPLHPLRARLAPGYVERCRGRIQPDDLKAALGQHGRPVTRTAADIKHAARAELSGDRQVMGQVNAVPLPQVVDPGKPRVREDGILHGN